MSLFIPQICKRVKHPAASNSEVMPTSFFAMCATETTFNNGFDCNNV